MHDGDLVALANVARLDHAQICPRPGLFGEPFDPLWFTDLGLEGGARYARSRRFTTRSGPMRQRSPINAPFTSSPRVVRLSPNSPLRRSRPSSRSHHS